MDKPESQIHNPEKPKIFKSTKLSTKLLNKMNTDQVFIISATVSAWASTDYFIFL